MLIHSDKLRWLLWLRWKLIQRKYIRSGRATTILGTIILLLLSLIFGGAIAVATFFGYRFVPPPINAEILVLVLTGTYFFWVISPLLQVSTNEGLDVSKLELFPLTRWELMISLLLSTLFDTPTIALVLLLTAVVAGWAFSLPLALLALLTVIIFYAQVVGMAQLVIALLSRSLQSRRLRDLSIILIILVSASSYLCNFAFQSSGGRGFAQALLSGTFSRYLQWLPPGMAARAIQQASLGNWGISFVWLGALLVITVAVLYLWQIVVSRALTAPEVGAVGKAQRTSRRVEQIPTVSVETALSGRSNPLLTQIFAIAGKDVKYFRRDPQLLRITILPLFYVVFLVFSLSLGTRGGPDDLRALFAPAIVLISLFTLAYNALGFERQSLTTLFLFPVDPRRILWGKNLVVAALGVVEIILVMLVIGFISHVWTYVVPASIICLAGVGVVLGCGNVTSVFFPQRMRQAQRGFQATQAMSTEAGILRVVMSLVAMVVTLIILLPVGIAIVVPLYFHAQWLWIVTMPASLLYGALFYFVVTALVAPRMLKRTPEILAVVTKE